MWIHGYFHGLNGFKPIKHRYENENIDIWVCLNMGYVQPNYGNVHGDRDKPLELELGVTYVQIKTICYFSNSNLTNTHGGIMMTFFFGITLIVNGLIDKHLLGYHMIFI